MQLAPYLEAFGPGRVPIVSREELDAERDATMRRVFEFCEVDPGLPLRAVRARVGDRERKPAAASG